MNGSGVRVEVAYAAPRARAVAIEVTLDPGATVEEAIRRSGILARFPEIDLARNRVGIFGEPARLNDPLRDNDRVEIYRPLVADPREARRQRAGARKAARR